MDLVPHMAPDSPLDKHTFPILSVYGVVGLTPPPGSWPKPMIDSEGAHYLGQANQRQEATCQEFYQRYWGKNKLFSTLGLLSY